MKKRLDLILLERGLFPSREQARTAIMTGRVLIKGEKQTKAGTPVDVEAKIDIIGEDKPFVSRGGLKLDKAVRQYNLELSGKTVMDIGASTGGFTDCALQNGAAKVYAVDVGYGQLAWSLRNDERVVVLEKTNARYLTMEQVPESVDVITIDASFISLKKLIPNLIAFLKPQGRFVVLIKPQFEAGREKVGKKGVVRDPATHVEVITDLLLFFVQQGLKAEALTYSPVRGPEGNREYLAILSHGSREPDLASVPALVDEAFKVVN
ncbi:MAG: TlyA family RNA methyltransferase [Bacillota bacterium]|nr:TlyA family RNA methyltransferase [Bacillota bacterium]